MQTGYLPRLPCSVLPSHRVLLAVTALLAVSIAVSTGPGAAAPSDEPNDWNNVRPSALDPPSSGRTVQPDDPFMLPYLAAEAMPGFAGVPTPLVVVVSPPTKAGSTTASETYVQISRMPPNATLSRGRNLGNGTWRVPLDDLPNLAITLGPDQIGTTRLSVTAISEHGGGLVGQRTVDLDVQMRALKATNALIPQREVDVPNRVTQSTSSATTETLALRSVDPPVRPVSEARPTAQATPPSVVALAVPSLPPNPPNSNPPNSTAAPADAQRLLKRGQELFAQGDLAGARLFFRRAAASGSAEASLALGKTYDPLVLERMHVRGLAPDPEQAVRLYGEAVAKGVGEADGPLKELTGWFATHRK